MAHTNFQIDYDKRMILKVCHGPLRRGTRANQKFIY